MHAQHSNRTHQDRVQGQLSKTALKQLLEICIFTLSDIPVGREREKNSALQQRNKHGESREGIRRREIRDGVLNPTELLPQ